MCGGLFGICCTILATGRQNSKEQRILPRKRFVEMIINFLLVLGLSFLCALRANVCDGTTTTLVLNDQSLSDLSTTDLTICMSLDYLRLEIVDQSITTIPPEIGQLTSVKTFDIYCPPSSSIISLPPEIGLLVNLETLSINCRSLTSLPLEIGQLVNLKEIIGLYARSLSALPSTIGQLTALEFMGLDTRNLTEIPSEIGQLVNLHTLVVIGKMASIPPEIGQLVSLQTLYIGSAFLTSLPPEIGQLVNLHSLAVTSKISSLPSEIGQLTNLQTLSITGTNGGGFLTTLPPLTHLANLQSLYLDTNLTTLPVELNQLVNVIGSIYSDHPFVCLPASVQNMAGWDFGGYYPDCEPTFAPTATPTPSTPQAVGTDYQSVRPTAKHSPSTRAKLPPMAEMYESASYPASKRERFTAATTAVESKENVNTKINKVREKIAMMRAEL